MQDLLAGPAPAAAAAGERLVWSPDSAAAASRQQEGAGSDRSSAGSAEGLLPLLQLLFGANAHPTACDGSHPAGLPVSGAVFRTNSCPTRVPAPAQAKPQPALGVASASSYSNGTAAATEVIASTVAAGGAAAGAKSLGVERLNLDQLAALLQLSRSPAHVHVVQRGAVGRTQSEPEALLAALNRLAAVNSRCSSSGAAAAEGVTSTAAARSAAAVDARGWGLQGLDMNHRHCCS
jgi:hypothetical protein